jgi:hypothetical protein
MPGHAAVCTPAAEYVPDAHAMTTASADAEHGAMMRWPGPAVEHGERVASFVAVHCAETKTPELATEHAVQRPLHVEPLTVPNAQNWPALSVHWSAQMASDVAVQGTSVWLAVHLGDEQTPGQAPPCVPEAE